MGLVEESDTTVVYENDEIHEAADANFANDRENHPIISNPNLTTNYIGL